MPKQSPLGLVCFLLSIASCLQAGRAAAQKPIGRTSATEVQVSGAVEVQRGEMLLGDGSTITATSRPVRIALDRGGELTLCSTTSLHLAEDRSVADRSVEDPGDTALMMALDRGALEAHYTMAKYSDVLLTPDLRILVSGPGEANLSIRINPQGDTCIDNHGLGAPYVTVSSQLEGGIYRVLPNQRVMFEHGSLTSVVDREPEPCGCPPAPVISVARAGVSSKNPARAGQSVGGPSSTPADTAFPIAESEGLASPPPPPSKPVVPVGETHAEVTAPLIYNGENPSAVSAAGAPAGQATGTVTPNTDATPATAEAVPSGAPPASRQRSQKGLFHRIGHFFSHLFH